MKVTRLQLMKIQVLQTMRPESGFQIAPNWLQMGKRAISDMTSSSNFFKVVLFLLSSLVTCPSLMSISSLVLEI